MTWRAEMREVVLALGLARAVRPRHVGVDQRDEVGVVRVEEVGRPRPVALVRKLERALDDVALGLDPDALAAEFASAHYRRTGPPGSSVPPRVRRRRDSPALVRPARGGRPGPLAVRCPHPRRAERPRRLQADARGAAGGAGGRRREGARVPDARARRLHGAQRRGDARRWPASGGRLRSLCRVQPKDPGAVAEARRCLDAGVNGIKLHPRAEEFTLSEPSVRELVAAAHEHKATVLIHAGRGIPALGQDTVRLSGEFPDARLILAHCAISDLAWLWRELPDHPNLFIDTAWWAPADVLATVRAVPARPHRVGERLALRPPARRRDADAADGAPGRAERRPAARGDGRADRAHARPRGPARPRPGARSGRAALRPAARARRHPPHDRDGARVRPRRLLPSRSRSPGSRARSATTPRRRRCAPPCSTCSTSSTSTWPRPTTAARSRRLRGCSCSR